MNSTKIRLTYCGAIGEGATVKEAKQDAARRLEKLWTMDFGPTLIPWKGRTAVVWNTPQGVVSAWVQDDGTLGHGTCHHGETEAIENVIASCKLNLAMNGADIQSDEMPAILARLPGKQAEYWSWLGFQRAYQFAKANDLNRDGAAGLGSTDSDWHKYGCDHSHKFNPATARKIAA